MEKNQPNDEILAFVSGLIYGLYYERNPLDAVERVLETQIYDPLSTITPLQRAAQIDEALHSDFDWTRYLPGQGVTNHSNADLRKFLSELSARIKQRPVAATIQVDPTKELNSSRAQIVFLLEPLINRESEVAAMNEVEKKLRNLCTADRWRFELNDHTSKVQYALRSNVPLAKLTGGRFSETDVRRYLRDVGLLMLRMHDDFSKKQSSVNP